jgi:hypothetical protein
MNDRSMARLLIAVILAGYGLYVAAFVPGMLIGPPVPLLLVGFVLQTVFGIAAAVAVWRGLSWAAAATILLGISIAVTSLVEAFVLGIVAWLYALLVAVLAVVFTMILAAYIDRGLTRNPRTP